MTNTSRGFQDDAYDQRRAITYGSKVLGTLIREGGRYDERMLLSIVHRPDCAQVVLRLMDQCCRNQNQHTRGGLVSEGYVGKERFAKTLEAEEYPFYREQVNQIKADYRRRKFWRKLFTLGLGTPPDEPVLPQHPFRAALEELIVTGYVDCVTNPDSPLRTDVVFPSPELIEQLMGHGQQTAAS